MEKEKKKEKPINNENGGSKSKTPIIAVCLLVILVAGALVWIIFFKDKKIDEKENQEVVEVVQRKKVAVTCYEDSETTFNGYMVKLVAEKHENPDCTINSFLINGEEKKEKLLNNGWGISQYEIFGDYLLYEQGTSSGGEFGVYNMKTDTLTKYTAEDMEYFIVQSWESDDKGITLIGSNVAEQWGVTTSHSSEKAKFRMTYVDGTFTDPIFLKEYD